MSYFVTGATGFIGRHLVQELIDHREGEIFVLVREGSLPRMQKLIKRWGSDRVTPVTGDLSESGLGVAKKWVTEHAGSIDHFFHLAAIYDMTADDATNQTMNVGGTRNALELADALKAGCFHQVSSVAAAGEYHGTFDETMFEEGQHLPSPYHRTKYESEKIVRDEATVPWRVYRPAIVVGDSQTGAMDKVDGPYYFFPLMKLMRDNLPAWLPLVGVDLGDTNVVPVDYVAKAMDHLAHVPGHDGEAFHLVNPEPQPVVEMINAFCAAAGAPQFATPVDRRLTRALPFSLVPRALRPSSIVSGLVRNGLVQSALDQVTGRIGVPAEVLGHVNFSAVFDSRRTEKALAGSGIGVPDLESYARTLWGYWEENLDESTGRDSTIRAALAGKYVVITGASSGIGQVTALKVAQAGGIPVLVARGKDKLEDTKSLIELRGGQAHVFPCDLSDLEAIDALCEQITAELPSVDFVVNNAGRSIRRSLKLSHDRFHDFERTMQLNYFGAIRLVMGLLPTMREQKRGHVVNISSIGVQTNPPRFSAYVASKSALDSWSNVVASELVGDGITFTGIHMPLVRTPMIAPTKIYDKFPTISPAQAADLVIKAMVERPHEINTMLGNAGAIAHTVAPKLAFRVLNMAYHVFPDSAAAKGDVSGGTRESEQIMLAKVFKGIHW
ncbi:NAD(P)-dependent dehydrogenase (short-subunit alcohol dehydrogenase family) [Nocardioides ginsengisegetis]|uniref:NAD(P)-dependent dehydrogenase (Short-subunit alcohol dehydrogenase family) n=1 Tax=Nocardioides ginsengisegetis TaxID=661491 RepID=A0A7W3J027_9ACTN|nr:SDR family oxidoreductase [Nocardioides ginsengisegetis]MBA8803791.1 NAD(P)-dependent dehydrogenase (short-subunit alcohol dehydrogenase family) [Nocardioides ginsengisegetis]